MDIFNEYKDALKFLKYTNITLIDDKIECKNPLGEYRRFVPQGTRLVGVTEDFVEKVLERKDFFSYEIDVTFDNGKNITVEDYSDNENIKELYRREGSQYSCDDKKEQNITCTIHEK